MSKTSGGAISAAQDLAAAAGLAVVGLAVVGATFGDGLAGVAWGTTGAVGLVVGAADGEALAGEACESCEVGADCGVGAPAGKAVAATATEASWVAAPPDTAGGIGGVTVVGRGAGVSGTGFRTSAARLGLAATTANPTRGRTARVRREPAEGRSTILRGLAPAMEEERLVRQSRESG
jgi:hypothetical protein